MPDYGLGIPQQTTNTLAGLHQTMESDKRNALLNRQAKMQMDISERKANMERLYILGKSADSVTDPASYNQWRDFMGKTFGEKTKNALPAEYSADFIQSKKAEANILYDALGKGKPIEVPMTSKDGSRSSKAIYGSPQYKRMIEKGWTQGELVSTSTGKTDFERALNDYKRRTGKDISNVDFKRLWSPKTDTGLSDKDIAKMNFSVVSSEYRTVKSDIADIEDMLMLLGDQETLISQRYKMQLNRKQQQAKELQRRMRELTSGEEKKTESLNIPQETIDYWRERGKTLEEIQEAYRKKFKDNPPKIGY